MKAPSVNPFHSKEYRTADKGLRFIAKASSYAARLAVFSTVLLDLLIRANELEVTEEDRVAICSIVMEISALSFSQSVRIQLHTTQQRRLLALETLNLPKDFNGHAVDRIPSEGRHIFGGKFLEAVDSDFSMNKRAKEVADRFKSRRSDSFRKFRGGRFANFPSTGRFRGSHPRGRGQSGQSFYRSRGESPAISAAPIPPINSTK